jgi:2-C-methyl-D-erythritol 4-phosphate cytidylyltransferase
MNTAVIVAAGSGQRFGPGTPKQFLEIKGRPVVEWSIRAFQLAPSVDEIVLVLAADRLAFGEELRARYPKIAHIVEGGDSRAQSVLRGLQFVNGDDGVVAVHDGARPLVTVDEIERTIKKAAETSAACLVAPVIDTIKSVCEGEITVTLDRSHLRRALTPQAFRIAVLRRAFDAANLDEAIPDECFLVERLGHPIATVDGSAANIKITHYEDLAVADALLDAAKQRSAN